MRKYFVHKRYNRWKLIANREFLWKQSFAMQEKQRLHYMEWDDYGCRHELRTGTGENTDSATPGTFCVATIDQPTKYDVTSGKKRAERQNQT